MSSRDQGMCNDTFERSPANSIDLRIVNITTVNKKYITANFSIYNMLKQTQTLLIFYEYSLFSGGQACIGLYC